MDSQPSEKIIKHIFVRVKAQATFKGCRDPEDVAQETLAKLLLEKLGDVEDESGLVPFAYSIAKGIIANCRRKKVGEQFPENFDPPGSGKSIVDEIVAGERRHQLGNAIRTTAEPCRAILIQKFAGQNAAYIQRMVPELHGLEMKTVYVRIHRCLAALTLKIGGSAQRKTS